MTIRTFRPADEAAQVAIYNEAAAALPKFKPATVAEVQRRTAARDFDPGLRFLAEEEGRPAGYVVVNANGRVSYPWCRPGHEHLAGPLFEHALEEMRRRGFRRAFAAYRADWTAVCDFFTAHGFRKAREMVNFVADAGDLPATPVRPGSAAGPLRREDVPALFALAPGALRVGGPAELEEHLCRNPYFGPENVFVLRGRGPDAPLAAAGVLITEAAYADPRALDANMPCFRLGAFGTENMQAKRVRGLFSFLAGPDADVDSLALDLLGVASARLRGRDDLGTLAAQAPSDVPHLLQFYQRFFRRQGAFPVFEREL
jgi:L-amino acid N-acyltransferase YncA